MAATARLVQLPAAPVEKKILIRQQLQSELTQAQTDMIRISRRIVDLSAQLAEHS